MTTATANKNRVVAPFELKAQDEGARTFEGIAAAYSLDLGGDVIHPGAFKRTLDHWKGSGRVLPLLDMHSSTINPTHSVTQHTLGKLVDARETDEGLWARFKVARTTAGDDLMGLLSDGMVEGLSIGYDAVSPRMEEGIRHLHEIKLSEISVVTRGMNPDALIDLSSVKAMLDRMTDEEKSELRALLPDPPAARAPGTDGPAHNPDDGPASEARHADEPEHIAPDDPKRLEVEAMLREIEIRSLAA